MFKNIILTGFMGVGKTSVGTRLAQDLGYAFVDTDKLIEADQKMTITAIFSQATASPISGRSRQQIIREVMQRESQVVSTGGGAVIRETNREAFKKAGFVVCLTARPEVIFERIKHETHRPLLQTAGSPGKDQGTARKPRKILRAGRRHRSIPRKNRSTRVISEIKERIRHAYC